MTKPVKHKATTKKKGMTGFNQLMAIPPEDIEALRRGVFNVVRSNLPRVREVIAGSRKWDNNQVKLYLALMNKVMPELSASYSENHTNLSMDELSTEQLRAIVAAGVEAAPMIDATPIDQTPIPDMVEPATMLPSPILPEPEKP